ncbi:Sec-independent protein translocase subunit TatA/TatB [Aquihabitans sp. McL0605]|uniref:Sec-independent protein translocase subunit TatA/TatB n=1 Tax=Aquihabitans sp. McL0605 TaxID=3415671 RepID=UPI003CE6EBD5
MINMPGGPELLVIFLVALVVLGPQQLPKAMRTFGNVMAEVRKVSSSFQAEMRSAMDSVVDSSATEKPQSGTMAPATPAATSTPAADDIIEVAARNDAPVASTAPGTVDPGDTAAPEPDPAEAAPARPAIDPADRAAG